MQTKTVAAVLGGLIAVLAVALVLSLKKCGDAQSAAASNIASYSNQMATLSSQLSEQRKVNDVLEGNLAQRVAELSAVSNRLQRTESTLTIKQAEAEAAARAAAAEISKRDKQISGLEGEKDDLTKRMADLNKAIDSLGSQISETQRKLAASEGDRAQLMAQLRRLQAEKAELEKRFQDLAVLREQVKKLKEELSTARRVEFLRKGLYGFESKGGPLLQRGIRPPGKATQPGGDVQVEVDTKGGTKMNIPAVPAAPPQTK